MYAGIHTYMHTYVHIRRHFAEASQRVSVDRLRKVYKHNRDNDTQAAEATAAEDMDLLCRIWIMCEHTLNQTAIWMHNEELARICRLLDITTLGSIQTESFLRIDTDADVSIDVPYSREEESQIAQAVHLVLMPDGKQLLEAIEKEMGMIYSSLSYSMRPRLVPKIDQYIAPAVLSKYVARKPEYVHCVTKSWRFSFSYDHLRKVLSLSEVSVCVCFLCVRDCRFLSLSAVHGFFVCESVWF